MKRLISIIAVALFISVSAFSQNIEITPEMVKQFTNQEVTPEMMEMIKQYMQPKKIETVRLDGGEGELKSTKDKPDYSESYIEIYPAANPNGICVIMCPGGGYAMESQDSEGRAFADYFNARGVTYCMLQYRLPAGQSEIPLQDAENAIRYMRSKAQELGLTKIGIMGASAGGHLASTLATHYSSQETRPDFQILLYPVITMDETYTHQGSRDNLLGKNPSQALVDLYSNEKHVTPDTPKAFIVLTSDDMLVPVANSLNYYKALVDNKVEATLICFPTGNHGFGYNDTFRYKPEWLKALDTWLNDSIK